jgi:hypothetical protein
MDIVAIARQIEELATDRPFGQLQIVRARLKGKSSLGPRIFRPQSIFRRTEDGHDGSYAFHFGGRRELQFNVGFEDKGNILRYGVAFSFQGSRTLGSLDVLKGPVERFNQFVRINPAYLSRFSMWHFKKGIRSERLPVASIPDGPDGLFRWGVFVFAGSIQPAKARSIDFERILTDLDWLMPLYEFVEGRGKALPVRQSKSGFVFQPGCSIDNFSAKAVLTGKAIEIDLRQRRIQKALHSYLVARFGEKNVGTEQPNLNRRVDLAVRKRGELWYYEVKIAHSVQRCIREALGQLMEYSYWPGLREAVRLIIVGEHAPTASSRKYILALKKRFNLPVEYQQFNLASGELTVP